MQSLTPPSPRRFSLLTAGGAIVAAALFTAVAYAVAAGPILYVDIKASEGKPFPKTDKDKGKDSKDDKGKDDKGKDDKGGSNLTTTNTTNEVFYAITITNAGKTPVTDVSVEYHLYVKSTIGAGVSLEDFTGTETIATLDPNQKKVIEPPPVKKQIVKKESASGIVTAKKGKSATIGGGGGGIESSMPIGTYVVVKVGDKVVREKEDPVNVRQTAASIKKNMR